MYRSFHETLIIACLFEKINPCLTITWTKIDSSLYPEASLMPFPFINTPYPWKIAIIKYHIKSLVFTYTFTK